MEFERMTYKEFLDFCGQRAADGKWGISQAMVCLTVRGIIEINNKGFLKKWKKEKEWIELRGVVIDAFNRRSKEEI